MKKVIAKNLGLGVELAIVILLPIYVGFELDNYLETTPGFFIFSAAVSAGGFTKIMNRIQNQYKEELKDLEDDRRR